VAVINGDSTTYSPEAGLRWEWQLQTHLTRTVDFATIAGTGLLSWTATPWAFTSVSGLTENDPWYYLTTPNGTLANATSQPTGWTVIEPGLPAFEETISGTVQEWIPGFYVYHNGNYGFQPTNPEIDEPPGQPKAGQQEDPWIYYFAAQAELTLTNSVKADNPIGIH